MKLCRLFVLLAVWCLLATNCYGSLVCDFDGNSTVDDNDLAILIGWKQLINAGIAADQITSSVLLSVSKGILASVSVVSRIPASSRDNLTDEAVDEIDDEDLAFFIAFKQLENAGIQNFSFDTVKLVAKNILSTLTRSMGKAPGVPVGDSTVPVTITGIQVDP